MARSSRATGKLSGIVNTLEKQSAEYPNQSCRQLCFVWRNHDVYNVDLDRSYALGNLVAETESGLLPPIHPGDILLQDFTRPHLISTSELALAMRLPPTQIDAVIHGTLGITAHVAFGLGSFFWYHIRAVAELAARLRFASCRNRQARRDRLRCRYATS